MEIGKIGNPDVDGEQKRIKQEIAAKDESAAEEVVSAKESPQKKDPLGDDSNLNIPATGEEELQKDSS